MPWIKIWYSSAVCFFLEIMIFDCLSSNLYLWSLHLWLFNCDSSSVSLHLCLFICDLFICDLFICDLFNCDSSSVSLHLWSLHLRLFICDLFICDSSSVISSSVPLSFIYGSVHYTENIKGIRTWKMPYGINNNIFHGANKLQEKTHWHSVTGPFKLKIFNEICTR